jgi:bifunctional NMN adenylyltransferase/nudix hydrolase
MNGIFIGRFQPMHAGHLAVLSQAASRCTTLLILVGSSNTCRSIKNPWTYAERKAMIANKLRANKVENFIIKPLNDYPYNDPQWISDVRETVDSTFYDPKPTLFGHFKEGNDYLRWFPDWRFQDLQATVHTNATWVRINMFNARSPEIPQTVLEDWDFYQNEAVLFKDYPFPETLNFNCADAVVECAGHILLIQRKRAPGRDTWALPGGFRNRADKSLKDAAIRELVEETCIKVPEKVLRGSIVKTELFDSNTRSFGIPRNTLAVYFRINTDHDGSLPKIKPADDALNAKWVPVNDALNKLALYDDHKHIISSVTGVMPRPAYINLA